MPNQTINIKEHYKMYKSGKRWLYVSLAAATLMSGGVALSQSASADEVSSTPTTQVQNQAQSATASNQKSTDTTTNQAPSASANTASNSENTPKVTEKTSGDVTKISVDDTKLNQAVTDAKNEGVKVTQDPTQKLNGKLSDEDNLIQQVADDYNKQTNTLNAATAETKQYKANVANAEKSNQDVQDAAKAAKDAGVDVHQDDNKQSNSFDDINKDNANQVTSLTDAMNKQKALNDAYNRVKAAADAANAAAKEKYDQEEKQYEKDLAIYKEEMAEASRDNEKVKLSSGEVVTNTDTLHYMEANGFLTHGQASLVEKDKYVQPNVEIGSGARIDRVKITGDKATDMAALKAIGVTYEPSYDWFYNAASKAGGYLTHVWFPANTDQSVKITYPGLVSYNNGQTKVDNVDYVDTETFHTSEPTADGQANHEAGMFIFDTPLLQSVYDGMGSISHDIQIQKDGQDLDMNGTYISVVSNTAWGKGENGSASAESIKDVSGYSKAYLTTDTLMGYKDGIYSALFTQAGRDGIFPGGFLTTVYLFCSMLQEIISNTPSFL